MTTGERIKQSRLEKGLSQKELATVIDVKQNTISQWETGKNAVPIEMLTKLAIALSCDPNYLLGFGE